MTKYPIRFLLPNEGFKKVCVESNDFPKETFTEMIFNERNNCFTTTIELPPGKYSYQFNADGKIIDDLLRAPQGGSALLRLGDSEGVIFELDKVFIKNNHIILTLGIDRSIWHDATLNIQTLQGIETIKGYHTFFEGSYEYQLFVVCIPPDSSLLAYFEISNGDQIFYLGENGLKEQEWSISPIEISVDTISIPSQSNEIIASYYLTHSKVIQEFEKHHQYFEKFPADYIMGDIEKNSILFKDHQIISVQNQHTLLASILRDIFIEKEDINPSFGLLGRYAYESRQDISTIPFFLSDSEVSFWHLCRREIPTATRGIIFQLLCTVAPQIVFGEEIGLVKTGNDRSMYWTKTKWNKELYNLYIKLLKLRKKYPVLRQGNFRFVLQDCCVWGIERYMPGEESIYIFANHSKNNVVIDLTQIMNHSGAIIELLTDHPLKRKRVCTLFGESVNVFKMNGIHMPLKDSDSSILDEEL